MLFDLLVESMLKELFSSTIKSHWSKVKDNFITSFSIGSKSYQLNIEKSKQGIYDFLYQSSDDEDVDYVDLTKNKQFQTFVNSNPDLPVYSITFEDLDYTSLSNSEGKSSFGITGGGNSIKVFSNVIGILRDFLSSSDLFNVIHFSASEPSRIKLYTKMVSVLAPELNYNTFTYFNINRTKHYILYK